MLGIGGSLWFGKLNSMALGCSRDQGLGEPNPMKGLSPAPESLCLMIPADRQDFRGWFKVREEALP